jgi:hypothetical protein
MILNPSVRIEPVRTDSRGPRIVPARVCLLAAHLDRSDTPAIPGMHAPLHHVAAAIFRIGSVMGVVVVGIVVIIAAIVGEHRGPGAPSCIDQSANVGIAGGDDAVEWHGDFLVTGQCFQPFDIGLPGVHRGLLVGEVGGALVDFLHRDEIRGDQRFPTIQRRFG